MTLVLALLLSTASAQYRVETIAGATSDVWDAVEHDGTLYVATSGGLVVRRGDDQRVFTRGLPGVRARSVSIDDGVWVGTIEGAVHLDRDLAVDRSVPLRRVVRVVRFGDALWFGTASSGLYRMTSGAPVPVRLSGAHTSRITDLVVHRDALYVATQGLGVFCLDASGRTIRYFGTDRGLPDYVAWDLESDGRKLLAGTLRGIAEIGRRAEPVYTEALSALPTRDVRRVRLGRDGVYAGTWAGGAWRLDGESPSRLGTASNVRALTARFIGAPTGLERIGESALLAPSLDADITALARDGERLYAGTYGAGLFIREHGSHRALDHARWPVDPRINDLAVLDHTLYIATDRGLYAYDGRAAAPIENLHAPGTTEHVTALHVDGGELWVTSSRRLSRFDGARWSSWRGDERFPISHLHAVTTDRHGRAWAGSLHGLFALDEANGRFDRHSTASGALSVDWVTSVTTFGDTLVAGTYHGGLTLYDGARFTRIREGERGLSSGWINPHAITAIGDRLFVGTLDRGLLIGTRDDRGELRFATLRIADGLPSDDVTDILADGERAALVATRAGLSRVSW
jgi:ligand-binding sensor domain-containing protein